MELLFLCRGKSKTRPTIQDVLGNFTEIEEFAIAEAKKTQIPDHYTSMDSKGTVGVEIDQKDSVNKISGGSYASIGPQHSLGLASNYK
jgi:hypothetical protein